MQVSKKGRNGWLLSSKELCALSDRSKASLVEIYEMCDAILGGDDYFHQALQQTNSYTHTHTHTHEEEPLAVIRKHVVSLYRLAETVGFIHTLPKMNETERDVHPISAMPGLLDMLLSLSYFVTLGQSFVRPTVVSHILPSSIPPPASL